MYSGNGSSNKELYYVCTLLIHLLRQELYSVLWQYIFLERNCTLYSGNTSSYKGNVLGTLEIYLLIKKIYFSYRNCIQLQLQ